MPKPFFIRHEAQGAFRCKTLRFGFKRLALCFYETTASVFLEGL